MQSKDAVPVLELKGVSKSFGAVVALRNADLALYSGSIHAVVGENGAGKSTLVRRPDPWPVQPAWAGISCERRTPR